MKMLDASARIYKENVLIVLTHVYIAITQKNKNSVAVIKLLVFSLIIIFYDLYSMLS